MHYKVICIHIYEGCPLVEKLVRCSRCKIRKYCNVIHQKSDWFIHKKFCRPPLPEENYDTMIIRPINYDNLMQGKYTDAYALLCFISIYVYI